MLSPRGYKSPCLCFHRLLLPLDCYGRVKTQPSLSLLVHARTHAYTNARAQTHAAIKIAYRSTGREGWMDGWVDGMGRTEKMGDWLGEYINVTC